MEIISFTKENTWLTRGFIDFGWGNGYALIPQGHIAHGKDHDFLSEFINVHSGLTFSELVDENMQIEWGLPIESIWMWCVGFDTAHNGDNLIKWSKEKVEIETNSLKAQLENL